MCNDNLAALLGFLGFFAASGAISITGIVCYTRYKIAQLEVQDNEDERRMGE